jgi:hypothetical protein
VSDKSPLEHLGSSQLTATISAAASSVAKIFGLPITEGGWIAPIDWRLSDEGRLAPVQVANLANTLSYRWCDVLQTECRTLLDKAEAIMMRYDDIRRSTSEAQVSQYEFDA